MTRAIFVVPILFAFFLFLAFAGDKLAGPNVQPLAAELVDMAEAAQLAESTPPAQPDHRR